VKPVAQTILVPPLGNCFQACVASLLEVPIDHIPNFSECSAESWAEEACHWAARHGIELLDFKREAAGESVSWFGAGYYIGSGPSPRGDWNHSCVYKGSNMVHDPFPGGGGIKALEWVTILAPLSPVGLWRQCLHCECGQWLVPDSDEVKCHGCDRTWFYEASIEEWYIAGADWNNDHPPAIAPEKGE
jgi:hypothetical protein